MLLIHLYLGNISLRHKIFQILCSWFMNLNLEMSSCLRIYDSLCYVETWYQKKKLVALVKHTKSQTLYNSQFLGAL